MPERVVICGGGVIGTSIAYFLALARRSFALHAELADKLRTELDLEWGYRRLDTLSIAASEQGDFSSLSQLESPAWVGPKAVVHSRIGTEETTAQVHPALFTRGMMTAAETNGAKLMMGTVEGIALADDGNRIAGVIVDDKVIEADAAVIAMGPWSILACQWLPLPAVYGLKGHSIVLRFEPSEPRALFVELETETGAIETPEVMPRTDGTTYVCGLSSEESLPVDPAQVREEPGAPERLRAMTAVVAPELAASEMLAQQACFRPVTMDGIPLIGPVPGVRGAYVATGHSVWGMLNGPATGEAMAELIVDGAAASVDMTHSIQAGCRYWTPRNSQPGLVNHDQENFLPVNFDQELNSRLQALDPTVTSHFVHQDAFGLHPHKRLITEVYPHPIRRNSITGNHDYFEGLTYKFLANFPESHGIDLLEDGTPVITFTASMRHRDFSDRSKYDSLLFTGDPSGEAWDQPAKRTPFVYCAPVTVPALGPDTIIARGVYLVEKEKSLTYSKDDGKCIWAYCRSDDRGETWGEIVPQQCVDDGREPAADLCH